MTIDFKLNSFFPITNDFLDNSIVFSILIIVITIVFYQFPVLFLKALKWCPWDPIPLGETALFMEILFGAYITKSDMK